MEFETLFVLAAGAVFLSLAVASAMSRRERRIPIRVRRND